MKILIIDDHTLFREGLSYVLNRLENKATILEANDYAEAFKLLSNHEAISLVLLDLFMPGKDGFSVLETARQQYPLLPIIVLSASKNISDMQRAMAMGAMGFIAKDSTSELMLNVIKLVLSGGLYIPPDMLAQQQEKSKVKDPNTLTPRQKQVMAMIAQGLSNKVIAADLGIAEATIKMHVTSIMKSLGVSNRTQAVIAVKELGISLSGLN